MKGRILESEYIPYYSSYVLKQTKYGTFGSEVTLNQEEDRDIENSFDGCRIAEFDCDLKSYKEKAKWMRQRAIGARTLYNNIVNSAKDNLFDWTNPDALKAIERQVEVAFQEADKAKEYYERMRDYRPIFIENLLKQRRDARKLKDRD